MTERSESYILCEGYHDRAFWGGLLTHLQCRDARKSDPSGNPLRAVDPWGRAVVRGQHGYYSKSNKFIRVVPAHGRDKIIHAAQIRLGQARGGESLTRLVVNVDADLNADGTTNQDRVVTVQHIETMLRGLGENSVMNNLGEFPILGGRTTVSVIRWETDNPPANGIPNKNTLERVICAALTEQTADCGNAVHAWLDGRPIKPAHTSPKEHAWSWLAGWHTDCGSYEGFCTKIWGDSSIAPLLGKQLKKTNAWFVAQQLAA